MKMKNRFLGILLSFALMLTMMPVLGLSQTAYAAGETWSESFTTDGGTIDGGVYVTADITLTIPDGITLNVNGGISGGKTLTVEGKGTLIINGMNGSDNDGHDPSALTGGPGGDSFTGNIIVDGPTVTVKGGTGGEGGINTSGGSGGSGGNGVKGDVTVNSGSIEATGGNGGTGGYGNEYSGGGGGSGGVGIIGVLTVTGGSATVTGGTGGKGGGGESGGFGSNGADGIKGDVTVTGGSATVTGGTGGESGDGFEMGEVGKAVSGTITGSAEESDDNSNWTAVSGTTSTKQYVKVTPSVTAYPLWVGETQVNSANAGDILGDQTASYVAESNTLTLNGATITKGHRDGDYYCESGIYYNGSELLNIVLADDSENTVEIAGGTCNSQIGICVDASSETLPRLNISGKGQLTVSGSNYGIHAPIITIDGCDVTASGGSGIHSYRGSIEIKGGSVYASATNYAIHAASDMVSYDVIINAGSKVTASGGNKAIFSKVNNAIAGIGWTDTAGTTGEANIAVGEHTRAELENFKKVQFPAAHTHDFTYTASGDTITATCSAEGCPLPVVGDQHVATLTIAAPLHTTYGDGNDAAAQITDANNIQGAAKVQYQKKTGESTYDTATETAPTNAGTYKASITLGTGNNSATASVEYTIAKADPTANAPSGLTATYGQTLADVALTNPTGNTPGSLSWADSSTSVGNVGDQTFKANFTPTDTANYNIKEKVDVTVTVNKADATEAMKAASAVIQSTNGATATVSYTLPDGASFGTVTNSNTDYFAVSTSNGLVLTAAKDWLETDWATSSAKTFTVAVTGATNYNNYSLTVSVTPTYKAAQTITVADMTVTYGDIGKKVTAKTDGDGTLSYAVKDGSGDYIGVDASTGALTIKKVGTATVIVTAAETDGYKQATTEVTVTINKANAVPATVTANNRTYDSTEKPLVTVTGETTGGTLKFAVTTENQEPAADAYNFDTTSIPTATNAGTYYVWYKVVGDENHNDVEPECLVVSIKEKEKQKPSNGTITTDGIYCASNYPSIQAGISIHKSNEADTVEYRWVACDSGKPGEWFEVSPWTRNNNWMDWTPEKSGEYVIVCYARVVGNEEKSEIQSSFGTVYHKRIKGICQMPYSGEGGGHLIGIESYDNPNNSYQYEMLILDCNLLIRNKDPWVYTTGRCKTLSNCLWTVWQPQYGYFWTLFRLYDADGNLIDELCYGFANVN